MQFPTRKINWKQELRNSPAVFHLRSRFPDRVPISQLQSMTDAFLDASSSSLFSKHIYERQTDQCDALFAGQLRDLQNEFPIREVGIIACAHALTAAQARGQLHDVQNMHFENPDASFIPVVSIYLQCLMIVHSIRPDVVMDDEAEAAAEIFKIVGARGDGGFPSVWRVLERIGRDLDGGLLPDNLVEEVLRYTRFGTNLSMELEELRCAQSWVQAHRICDGLRRVIVYPRSVHILQKFFPNYQMWASWRPDPARIAAWEMDWFIPHRHRLVNALILEGPDITGGQQRVLRLSSAGAFNISNALTGMRILGDLLDALDAAVKIGGGAVDLLVTACIDSNTLNERTLAQVNEGLSLRDDEAAQILANLVRALVPHSPVQNRVTALTDALPVMSQSQTLQWAFGTSSHLAMQASSTLTSAQNKFGRLLVEKQGVEQLGMRVQALASAMLASQWLHEHWSEGYMAMLRNIPPSATIRGTLEKLRTTASQESQQDLVNFLLIKLAGLQPINASTPTQRQGPIEPPVVIFDDPIWFEEMTHDLDRLRAAIKRTRDINPQLAVKCVKQSKLEKPSFVCDLVTRLRDSDEACVTVAACLGTMRKKNGRVDECWKDLLMHMMRTRSPGLLKRLGKRLMLPSWDNWIGNLNNIYGDRHLDPEGGLGFTREAITAWTIRIQGNSIGRSTSSATHSTSSTY